MTNEDIMTPRGLYGKTAKELMHEFAKSELEPDQIFSNRDVIDWFSKNYPKINQATVNFTLQAMTINSRVHSSYPHIRPDSGWDLFINLRRGEYRLWNKEEDKSPTYKTDFENDTPRSDSETGDTVEAGLRPIEFPSEKDLQDYLTENITVLGSGLSLYMDSEDEVGIEFRAGNGYIDILAVDADDNSYVVIEIKVSKAQDSVVGQILRYMAWVENNKNTLTGDANKVKGIIVANEISEERIMAASLCDNINIQFWEYKLSVGLNKVSSS